MGPKLLKRPGAQAPKSLSKAAADWWNRMMTEFSIDDDGGRMVLEITLLAWDRLEQARKVLATDGLTVTGAAGTTRPHPCIAIERDARSAVLAGFRALHLDLEPLRDGPGRPPGD